MVETLRPKVESSFLQRYYPDNIDTKSLYCTAKHPAERIGRHLQYKHYLLEKLLPLIQGLNPHPYLIAAGYSMGVYYTVNLTFRHPHLFGKVLGLSRHYDLTQPMATFRDLFRSYVNEAVYLHTPNRFLANLTGNCYLTSLRWLKITLAVGANGVFLTNNQFLSQLLHRKGINHQLHVWVDEAHAPPT